ncbi:MFS transporter [Sphingorhabdus sp. IMCC26285]|jgi:MFS family permease|uniref:MFS transporter n=2 Tax=Sphingorhabdus profundilacus TaxID=2509718 RepID=A0A6I4LVX9_9SPHN|nr:MFS transporter [Sphingorhabdus profundilacus]
MPPTELHNAQRQSTTFMYLYALAVSGGAVAYMPFLTILLPLRVTVLAPDTILATLAVAAFAGAFSASISNIAFGWASDVTRQRRGWILAGLIFSTALLLVMPYVAGSSLLIVMIVLWQFALNMMLAPLAAWAGDCIPDAQKGMLGGLLALAPALGALAGAIVTLDFFAVFPQRELLVACLVILMVGPVLLFGRPLPMPCLMERKGNEAGTSETVEPQAHPVARMWLARLLVQIAEASLFAFLLLWFRSLDPQFGENDAAGIFALVLGMAVFLSLAVGYWSDRENRPILPLIWSAGAAAVGLLMMALADGLLFAILGYVAFGIASSIFLALHSSQTLRVLPRPQRRGRDLGIFNLTNTVPSLIMPWLTLLLVPKYGFDALFLLLAALAIIACLLLLTMPRGRQAGLRA